MTPALRSALERALGKSVVATQPLSGGDINEAFSVQVEGGERVFVKTHANPPAGMFEAEAKGLRWLREADAIRIPNVVAVSDAKPAYLALEMIEPARRQIDFDAQLGRALAALHRSGAPCFGLDHDNFIGRLPQRNRAHDTWADFYWSERLEPQIERAVQHGHLDGRARRQFERLRDVLPERVGDPEPPSRLHGDLWGGNLHVDEAGAPCLIDPAVYSGHREVDLAMMRLFGGFGEGVFAAYQEAAPLSLGADDRVPLYQLYPLLVHVNLFGGGYVPSVMRTLAQVS